MAKEVGTFSRGEVFIAVPIWQNIAVKFTLMLIGTLFVSGSTSIFRKG